jgi:hypothetical protein
METLKKRCGRVDAVGDDHSKMMMFAFLDHTTSYQGHSLPSQAFVMLTQSEKPIQEALATSLHQTWDWPEVRSVAAQCKSQIMINEFMASGLDRKERLELFHNIVQSVMELAPCKVMHWLTSDRVVNPDQYLKVRQDKNIDDPLYPAANVRLFRIEGGAQDETLMDSLGLHIFGLPDVQCHFIRLEPNEVANVLGNSALYLFTEGDVIEDGHTIQGIAQTDKWRCQHEVSMVGPEREVLDINPGSPYAAGNRGRGWLQ